MTTVVNRKDTRDYDVYVGRPTPFGNPFVIGVHAKNNAEAVALFREWINSDDPEAAEVRSRIPALKGKRIACWCKPLPCHGDVLAEMADA